MTPSGGPGIGTAVDQELSAGSDGDDEEARLRLMFGTHTLPLLWLRDRFRLRFHSH